MGTSKHGSVRLRLIVRHIVRLSVRLRVRLRRVHKANHGLPVAGVSGCDCFLALHNMLSVGQALEVKYCSDQLRAMAN